MKWIFVLGLVLAAFVLLNSCVSGAEDKLDESSPSQVTHEHTTNEFGFDTENEMGDKKEDTNGDEHNEEDKDNESTEIHEDDHGGDKNDANKDKSNTEVLAKTNARGDTVVKTPQGVIIKVDRGGNIGISLTGSSRYTNHKTVYTRWGNSRCRRGARLLYNGYVGGSHYTHKGSGSNHLCMPKYPHYLSTTAPGSSVARLYSAEYETGNRIFSGKTQDYDVPCAVCQVQKSTKVMIPAKVRCPRGWTREYYGYLMAEYYNHWRSGTFECVDVSGGRIPGSKRNTNGALFYFTRVGCGYGLPCGPYISNRATTCVVCSA